MWRWVSAVVAVGLLGGCTDGPSSREAPQRAVSAPGIAQTPTLEASTSTPEASTTPITPTPSSSAQHSFTSGTRMPEVTGQRLSDANQRLVAGGFSLMLIRPHDGSDQGRVVLNTTNWIVQAQKPEAGATVDAHSIVTLTVTKPTDGKGDRSANPGEVPNVVCKDGESAVNLLRAAGFRELALGDGTGARRSIIVHENWVVIGQSAAPGSRPETTTKITLTVVKYGEPTGSSGCAS